MLKLKIGSKVTLKSGGPKMTVAKMVETTDKNGKTIMLTCKWKATSDTYRPYTETNDFDERMVRHA